MTQQYILQLHKKENGQFTSQIHPEMFREDEIQELFDLVIKLVKEKRMFSVYKIGDCVVDHSFDPVE